VTNRDKLFAGEFEAIGDQELLADYTEQLRRIIEEIKRRGLQIPAASIRRLPEIANRQVIDLRRRKRGEPIAAKSMKVKSELANKGEKK
jgi:hypothetical protein